MTWEFPEGHLLDARTQPLWIAARDEDAAMRILRDHLRARSMRPTG
jgi:hypothetical protein